MDDVVADELEVALAEEVGDVRILAVLEVVDADDVVAGRDQPVAEVAAEEAGAAGDENPLHRRHRRPPGPGTAFNAAATPPG